MFREIAERELGAAQQVLAVNLPGFARAGALSVQDVSAGDTPGEGFDGVLWDCGSDLGAGLRVLRARVRPEGLLIVGLRRREPAWNRVLRALSRDTSHTPPSFEALCAAPLLAGLEEPRVLHESPELAVVAARVPAQRSELDAHFDAFSAQPA